jgi:regulator of nucleoside diphosphate kinase
MEATLLEERTLGELDHRRLSRLIGRSSCRPGSSFATLKALLDMADVLPSHELPRDVVTMYSRVLLLDANTGKRRDLTLCYPHDAGVPGGFVSVLSPVGTSLLGLRAGSVATWRTPGGGEGTAELLEVPFQPEAHGIYTL